jgi:hypothetical protein
LKIQRGRLPALAKACASAGRLAFILRFFVVPAAQNFTSLEFSGGLNENTLCVFE